MEAFKDWEKKSEYLSYLEPLTPGVLEILSPILPTVKEAGQDLLEEVKKGGEELKWFSSQRLTAGQSLLCLDIF